MPWVGGSAGPKRAWRRWPGIGARAARRVVDRYNGVRGGLLAAGLAYGALFSILTGLLFFVGVVGLFVDLAEAVERLIAVLSLGGTPFEAISRDALVAASR